MKHLSDEDLLLHASGEASPEVGRHVFSCTDCQRRQNGLERQLHRAAEALHSRSGRDTRPRLTPAMIQTAVAASITLVAGAMLLWNRVEYPQTPDAKLTPGAVRSNVTRASVCSGNEEIVSAGISAPRAMTVFQRYSISRPAPRTFEVDYLIPPDLGGSDAPENLWPQPYASGVWNSKVKDALEDRLRAMVCSGELDLATAQQDLSRDWIAAYKKYFHAEAPLSDHAAFVKDRPWE